MPRRRSCRAAFHPRARPRSRLFPTEMSSRPDLPSSRVLSSSQLETLAEHGEERTAEVGEKLYEIGDRQLPLHRDRRGRGRDRRPCRGGDRPSRERGLPRGDEPPLRPDRLPDRRRHRADSATSRSTAKSCGGCSSRTARSPTCSSPPSSSGASCFSSARGSGSRSSARPARSETRHTIDFARRMRLPHSWTTPEESEEAAALLEGAAPDEIPIVRLPGGGELRAPSPGELSRALGIGLELAAREEVDLLVLGGGPAGLGAAVYGASEGLDTLVVESTVLGGQAGSSRRIENYLGFPAGISGTELTSRAVTQARKFGARTATPYRARGAGAGRRAPPGPARGGQRDRGPGRAARHRRRIQAPAGRGPRGVRGDQRLLRGRAARGAALRRAARRRDRRRQLGGAGGGLAGARRGAGHPPAPAGRPQRDDVATT